MMNGKVLEKLEQFKSEIDLKWLDWLWRQEDMFYKMPYPPSFYYYHTPEEIRQREKEDREKGKKEMLRLRALVAEMGKMDDEAKLRDAVCKMEADLREKKKRK